MDETKWAWLAGIIDGEGTLGVYYQGRGRRDAKRRCLTLCLAVANTSFDMLHTASAVIKSLGIQKAVNGPYIGKGNRQEHWALRYSRPAHLKLILPRVLPYLVVKRRQAEYLLKLAEAMPFYQGPPEWAQETAKEVRELNRVGNPERSPF